MMLPTKDEKSCLLFSTKILSSNKKKMDHCSGVFGSGYTGKLVFTDLSAKHDDYSIIESNKGWSDSLELDGWLKIEKYESDIYHYFCNCPSVEHVSFIYADSLIHVASTAHQCDLEYYDEIEEQDCNFPSHLGDDKIQFVCAMDFETAETTEIPETSTTTITTTESFQQRLLQQKLLLQELAKTETVTEANANKTEKEIRSPWSLDPYS